MTEEARQATSELINYLMSHPDGVGESMYMRLVDIASSAIGEAYARDLRRLTEATDGRFYLKEGITLEV